jgi:hypothetical protein
MSKVAAVKVPISHIASKAKGLRGVDEGARTPPGDASVAVASGFSV